ncbi:hypothetical protein RDI58_023963 [Solanum bulbocastanum]|uniref:Uncharacterized protein n=1 Tax=Solanum bulbocastanum TaxID=147425 RepID=A0AAN8T4W7_SOLBU
MEEDTPSSPPDPSSPYSIVGNHHAKAVEVTMGVTSINPSLSPPSNGEEATTSKPITLQTQANSTTKNSEPTGNSHHNGVATNATRLCSVIVARDGDAWTIHLLPRKDNEHTNNLDSARPLILGAHSQERARSCDGESGEPCLDADLEANPTTGNAKHPVATRSEPPYGPDFPKYVFHSNYSPTTANDQSGVCLMDAAEHYSPRNLRTQQWEKNQSQKF